MKKILTAFISVVIACSMLLGGCACNPSTPLTFSNTFYSSESGVTAPPVGYSESLEYDVTVVFNDGLDFSGTLEKAPTMNGAFTTTFERVFSFNAQDYSSDIKAGEVVFRYATELTLSITYDLKDDEEGEITAKDKITSEVFFLPSNDSFAPIYSYAKTEWASLNIMYEYTTVYNVANYTTTKKTNYLYDEDGNPVQNEPEINKQTYNYSHKAVIDNYQLLFALRSYTTNDKQSTTLPVVSPVYGSSKNISLARHEIINQPVLFTYNGQPVDNTETIPVRKFNLAVGEVNSSGMPQQLSIQTSASSSGKIPAKALLVKYVAPLFYGVSSIGNLEYNLTAATINQ